jgi:hypothetical protein
MHNVIEKAGQGESRVLGQYNKRDRTRAALLTAAIKAVIIDEIRFEAAERIHDPVESVLETLEGRMAEAAFHEILDLMTKKGGGIKVLKHPRSTKPPRVIKLKFKKMDASGWLVNAYQNPNIMPRESGGAYDEYDGDNEDNGRYSPNRVKGKNRKKSNPKRGKGKGKEKSPRRFSFTRMPFTSPSKSKKAAKKANPNSPTNGDDEENVSEGSDESDESDEFAADKWDHERLSFHKDPNEDFKNQAGPFLQYKGGFLGRTKKRIDLSRWVKGERLLTLIEVQE